MAAQTPSESNRAISGGTVQAMNNWTDQTLKNPLTLLREHAAIGALHDSKENVSPSRRHPSTEGGIIRDILEWSANPRSFAELLTWIHGPEGAGKSSIAHRATEELETQHLLAAAFFFSRSCPSGQRNNEARLVATIAYQLTQYIPVIRPYIETAITGNRAIFGLSLDQQVKYLILAPFQSLRLQRPDVDIKQLPSVIVVDALDECGDDPDVQTQVLETLLQLTTSPQIFPFTVIITSRLEPCIKRWFEGENVSRITAAVSLQDLPDKDRDIYIFVRDGFSAITKNHPYRHHLPLHWPPSTVINGIVNKSSGELAYATVVMAYIRDLRYIPSRRLDSILKAPVPNRDRPYADLDALYQLILSTAEHLEEIMTIIAFDLTIRGCQDHQLSVPHLERFLSLSLPIDVLLADIQAIFTVPLAQPPSENEDSDQRPSYQYHKSFEDHLTDPTRALPGTYLDPDSWKERFLLRSSLQAHATCRSLGLNFDERINPNDYVPWIWNLHCWYLKTAPPNQILREQIKKWEEVDLSTLFRIVMRLDVTQLLQSIKFSRLPETDIPYLQDRFVTRSLLPLVKEMIEIRMKHNTPLPISEARLIARTLRLYLEVYPRQKNFSARFENSIQELKSAISNAVSSSNHPVFDFLPSVLCNMPGIANISFALKDYTAETLSFLQIMGNLPRPDLVLRTHSAAFEDMLRACVHSPMLEIRIREALFIRRENVDAYVALIGKDI